MSLWPDDDGYPCEDCEHVPRCARGGLACIAFRSWVSDPPGHWAPWDREPNVSDFYRVFSGYLDPHPPRK